MNSIRTFQAGASRKRGEGLRVGVVRYLPRGVKKQDYARLDYFDVWLPLLAPSRELFKWVHADPTERWPTFVERYTREMLNHTDSHQAIQLLAKLAKQTRISIGCYCSDEAHCHRSILRKLIKQAMKG